MLTFRPIDLTDATLAKLNAVCQEDYIVDGDATHIARTPLGETALMFPRTQNEDGGRVFRIILLFRDADIPAYIKNGDNPQGPWVSGVDPSEHEIDDNELEYDGDVIFAKTLVSLI